MGLIARFECDGNGCHNGHELSPAEPYDFESIPDEWSFDEINEFCYCPWCVEKMVASGELEAS